MTSAVYPGRKALNQTNTLPLHMTAKVWLLKQQIMKVLSDQLVWKFRYSIFLTCSFSHDAAEIIVGTASYQIPKMAVCTLSARVERELRNCHSPSLSW